MIVVVRMSGRFVVTWLPVPIEPWAADAPRIGAPSATRPTTMRVTERARLGKLNILKMSSFWDRRPHRATCMHWRCIHTTCQGHTQAQNARRRRAGGRSRPLSSINAAYRLADADDLVGVRAADRAAHGAAGCRRWAGQVDTDRAGHVRPRRTLPGHVLLTGCAKREDGVRRAEDARQTGRVNQLGVARDR